MLEMVEQLALHNLDLQAQDISNQVMRYFEVKNKGKILTHFKFSQRVRDHFFIHAHTDVAFDFLTKDSMKKSVYYFRDKAFGDCEQKITSIQYSRISETDMRFFLQFKLDIPVKGDLKKIIGFGHPDLIEYVKHGPCNLFIDMTFSIVPNGFSQCMILMTYSRAHQTYLPFMYILMQGKTSEEYWHCFNQVIACTDWQLRPDSVTHDFEAALLDQVRKQFPNDPPHSSCFYVLCLFHWKQCLRKKLKSIGMPQEIITNVIGENGIIDILTVIPIKEIETKGIYFIDFP